MNSSGKLISVGIKMSCNKRTEFFACVDCKTEYPRYFYGSIMCNGHVITKCPWCRTDSKPWYKGRGL